MGYDDRSIQLIGSPEGTMLLEGFLHMIATCPDARLPSATTQLQGSMLLLYLKAAALWLQTSCGQSDHAKKLTSISRCYHSGVQMGYPTTQAGTLHTPNAKNVLSPGQ